jgi:hypothetical protein
VAVTLTFAGVWVTCGQYSCKPLCNNVQLTARYVQVRGDRRLGSRNLKDLRALAAVVIQPEKSHRTEDILCALYCAVDCIN